MSSAVLVARFFLGFLFLFAGVSKWRADEMQMTVERYGLLPQRLVAPVARWLPRIEVLCAVMLLLGVLTSPVAFVMAALLVAFAVAAALVLASGREVDCGCFGSASRSKVRPMTVVRDLALAAAAVLVGLRPPSVLAVLPGGPPSPSPAITAGDAVVVPMVVASVMLAVAVVRANRALGPVPTGRVARR